MRDPATAHVMQVLRQLRTSVSSGSHPLSEAEMDRHTLRGLREVRLAGRSSGVSPARHCLSASWRFLPESFHRADRFQSRRLSVTQLSHVHISKMRYMVGALQDAAADGREAKSLVYVRPEDNMAVVVERLFDNRCSMAPILSGDPNGAALASCSTHPNLTPAAPCQGLRTQPPICTPISDAVQRSFLCL